ncbi:hypothetical protein ELH42_35960 [Rhizobium ruizarguesonis]|uniref:Uncharacterized protein n=1 Tax=Rhizobium ruizarguesonis TaxID=2081791 RepID=A0AB38HTE1_9HYPH|nr:hypothetical protein ELH61_29625 [Rhizobium ruizarguesonis]TBA52591.1 hypothetical protein ELH57_33675 [Rhizobium ruizarguesonis]TBB57723.1 hypothetical protein ELH42_35960 [Rhizobium ruizarguesonis]TBB60306.1 hypothetical protein ELH45_33775 [Rhizobium ruizarguesonis]TBB82989.1 hypothetical protein ELH39_33410 [Rhizobium ruizarguesonis]
MARPEVPIPGIARRRSRGTSLCRYAEFGITGFGLTRSATAERQGGQVFSRSPNCARMGRLFAAYSIGQRSSS